MNKSEKKTLLNILKAKGLSDRSSHFIFIIMLIEITCLCILLFQSIVSPKSKADYPLTDFSHDDFSNITLDDFGLSFSQAEGITIDQLQEISGNRFSLSSGAYQFYIEYESVTDGTKNYKNNTGTISLTSDYHKIESEIVTLDDGHSLVSGRFWIPVFSRCNDLSFLIQYNGQGTLKVTNIRVSEFKRYRAIRFLGYLLLIVIIDALYIILFTDYNLKGLKSILPLLAIILISSIPFLDEVTYKGHDLWFHMNRIISLSRGLIEGQFPVRISTESNNGYGYAYSLYYCDIFLYPSAILYAFMVPLRICYQFYVILVNTFTAACTYYSMSKFTKRRRLMLLGTGLYMLCPYRLVNLNIRSAVGEYTAMIFLPLIVAGLYSILKEEKPTLSDWLPLAFGMSGVIMSHVVTAEMLTINIAILFLIMLKKTIRPRRLLAMAKAALSCVMMTAWFLVPFIDSVLNQKTMVQKNDLRLLNDSSIPWASIFELFSPGHDNQNYKSLGIALVTAIIIIIYSLYIYKTGDVSDENEKTKITELRIMSLFSLLNVWFVSNSFPWNRIQNLFGIKGLGYQLGTVQFAWRFYSIASIMISISVIIALDNISNKSTTIFKLSFVTLIASAIIGCGFFYFSFFDYAVQEKNSNKSYYDDSDYLYFPEGTNPSIRNISNCCIKDGDAKINDYKKTKGTAILQVDNSFTEQESKISVPIFAYNNYHAYESKGNTISNELYLEKDENNCIQVTIPAGYKGNIVIRYIEPLLWRIAEIISLISWITAFVFLIKQKHLD